MYTFMWITIPKNEQYNLQKNSEQVFLTKYFLHTDRLQKRKKEKVAFGGFRNVYEESNEESS